MSEFTELHPAGYIPAAAIITEVIPDYILRELADALIIGLLKHKEWEHDKDSKYYQGALSRHWKQYQQGEVYDQKDGQHHLAAVIIRACQLIGNEGMDTQVAGFGVC